MSEDSTFRPSGGKARPKPLRKDFPWRIRIGMNYWCKRIRGRVHYFGRVTHDPSSNGALDERLRVK